MHRTVTRRAVIAGTVTALAGCLGGGGSDTTTTETQAPTDTSTTTTSSTATTTGRNSKASIPLADEQLPMADSPADLVDASKTGARRDAIPALDDPTFVDQGAAEIAEDDVVFGLATGDTVRAYPQTVLVWHEIVNDVVEGNPVSITYCPLTGTVLGFERGETTFGVSGKLVNNNLVMYDRASESWWSQILATGIKGPHTGDSLRQFPLVWTRWRRWRMAYPETEVLSRDTGYLRNYGSDPYGNYSPKSGYYSDRGTLFDPLREDDRFHPKNVVVGTRADGGTVAVNKSQVTFHGMVTAGEYVAVHDADMDAVYLYHNPEQAAFTWDNGTVEGPDGSYEPDSMPLTRVMAFDAMWFAWAGFYPDTAVYPSPE